MHNVASKGLHGNFTKIKNGTPRVNSFIEEFQGIRFCKKKLRNIISTAKLLAASGRKYERLERIKRFNKTKLRPGAVLEFVNGSASFRISLHSFTCFYKRR